VRCTTLGGILSGRLDEDKVDQLRRWGAGLTSAESEELRATGKAILLLIEEIEALHVELWNAKAAPVEPAGDGEDHAYEADIHRSLSERLRFSRGHAARDA
jgi:hypothetical protein